MSEEIKDIEQVEAEVVEEGKKAITLEDAPIAPEAPEPNFSEADVAGTEYESKSSADAAGTQYESKSSAYVEQETKVLGIISLVCGILSVVCCCGCYFPLVTGIAAVVLGIVSLKKEPSAKSLAIAGIICGAIGGVLGICGIIFSAVINASGDSITNSLEHGSDFLEELENIGNL